jgi:hypothetical protein
MIAGLPEYDNTDVYAFVSPDKPGKVNLIANWIPFEEPAGGPNFYPFADDAQYDIHIDNDGDAVADLTYRWVFKDRYRTKNTFLYNTGVVTSLNDADLNFRQTYDLKLIAEGTKPVTLLDNAKVAPSRVGEASMPNYPKLMNAAVTEFGAGPTAAASFAGQAEDPFFLDLRVFDLLYGGDLSEVGYDTLRGYNVNTIAYQVSKKVLTGVPAAAPGKRIVGVWSTTQQKGADGKFRQVSRLGNPLVNEVVIPIKDKDKFNRSKPVNDTQFLDYVTMPELPQLIEAIYGIPAPKEPRDDLVQVFLTGVPGLNQPKGVTPSEQLRLNVDIAPADKPKRLGVIAGDTAGFPNGRRLTDDVVDIALQVVEGELVGNPNDLGDAVNTNDRKFDRNFPYVALPRSGSRIDYPGIGTRPGTTALNGGAYSNGGSSGGLDASSIPVLPITAMGLGFLALIGAGVTAVRRPRVTAA